MEHQGTQVLESGRLLLRPFVMEDAPAMYRNWASDEEVTKFLTWPAHKNLAITQRVLREWTAQYSSKTFYQWAIVEKPNGPEPIGCISVTNTIDAVIQSAHVGCCIGRAFWRKGIASEALHLVISFLFETVGVKRVEARHDPRNPNSGAVMQKSGMHYAGTLRQADWNNQGICDACFYDLLADEYRGA